jgi:hypothetical protein
VGRLAAVASGGRTGERAKESLFAIVQGPEFRCQRVVTRRSRKSEISNCARYDHDENRQRTIERSGSQEHQLP